MNIHSKVVAGIISTFGVVAGFFVWVVRNAPRTETIEDVSGLDIYG